MGTIDKQDSKSMNGLPGNAMPLALALHEVRLSAVQEQASVRHTYAYTKKTTRSKLYFLSSLGFFPC